MSDNVWPLTIEYILKPRSFWGGPCDIYEMSENKEGKLEYPKTFCHQTGATMNNSMNIGSTAVREGYRIKSCEEIINNQNALSHAMRKSNLVPNDPLTVKNVRKIYQLFHPARNSYSDEAKLAMKALIDIKPNEKPNSFGWKHILLTLCYDPSWQIL